jgi:hypothetical protein
MFSIGPHRSMQVLLPIVAVLASAAASAQPVTPKSCATKPVAEGCGTFTWPDGTRYVGGFHGGFFDGPATVTYPDGARLEVTFQNGDGGGELANYTTAAGAHISGAFHDVSKDIAHLHPPVDYPFWRGLFGDRADVVVAAIVDESGTIRTAQLYRKIDSESYTTAALSGVRQWRYLPATVAGTPIPMPHLIEIQFSQPH